MSPPITAELIDLIRDFLRKTGAPDNVHLSAQSCLQEDLALESLARMELLQIVEQHFRVKLNEQDYLEAQQVADLVRLLENAAPDNNQGEPDLPRAERALAGSEQAQSYSEQAETLTAALDWQAAKRREALHAQILQADHWESWTYGDLAAAARRTATGLLARGLKPGECVALMLPTSSDFLSSFLGILYAGGIAVPLYPPASMDRIAEHLRKQSRILNNCRARLFISGTETLSLRPLLQGAVPTLNDFVLPRDLRAVAGEPELPVVAGENVAFLQYTSGSTGDPKGVALTHANLIANIKAMGAVVEVQSDDVFVSWLPLYHDMGLIGAWLTTLFFGLRVQLMPPLTFLRRPRRWLETISRCRGTLAAAPNFAYQICVDRISKDDVAGLDLSHWRVAFNGAEPVSPVTLRAFGEHFAAAGFKATALLPVYGLAENAVGLCFPPPGRGVRFDRVKRIDLETQKMAIPVSATEQEQGQELVELPSCGRPLPGHQVRIVNQAGQELSERMVGILQFRGPSATAGYWDNPEANRLLLRGEWRDSGDNAYLAEGEVYIVGRVKDLIIRAGRNIYPQELEEAIGKLSSVRQGCVAVFSQMDHQRGTEKLVVAAETRLGGASQREALRREIARVVTNLVDLPPDKILLLEPKTVPKTSSGKIRRSECKLRYEQGTLRPPASRTTELLQLYLTGLPGLGRRALILLRHWLQALRCGLVLGLVLLAALPTVFLSPSRRLRLAGRSFWAAFLLRGFGVNLQLRGREVPAALKSAVFVANHSSYLDAVVLAALLPGDLCYVAKRDFVGASLTRWFLAKLGAVFVERYDTQGSLADTSQLEQLSKAGQGLVFFPEGTFRAFPGLLPFKLGAFVLAAQCSVPIVPMAIVGTREIMPTGSWVPRPGTVAVTVAEPIASSGEDFESALSLRDAARGSIERLLSQRG